MPNLLIIEPVTHPAPARLAQGLLKAGDFVIRTVHTFPEVLDDIDALILNSLPPTVGSVPADRIIRFVERGGGIFAVHDTVYPYGVNSEFISACGIRGAYGAMQIVHKPEGAVQEMLLAVADPDDPLQRFPVRPIKEGIGHPILDNIGRFEMAEEVWAQNLAPDVRPLLEADVGDRLIIAPQRFREGPIPVAACRSLGYGRLAFFSLGHFAQMYVDQNFLKLAANVVRWITKQTNERQYRYDLFLSFSSQNRDEGRLIVQEAQRMDIAIYQDEKDIQAGSIWSESLRSALVASREIALVASPDSLRSEWVQTELGAAWVLERTITPILFRIAEEVLPGLLQQRQSIDFHRYKEYLQAVKDRCGT